VFHYFFFLPSYFVSLCLGVSLFLLSSFLLCVFVPWCFIISSFLLKEAV
jgi:hypothetical protein